MFLILLLAFLVSSVATVIPDNVFPLNSDDGGCPIIKERKTLVWDFILEPYPAQNSINRVDLTAPGAGFVWRGEAYYYPDVTRPILFQTGQGWSIVNCTAYFAKDDPARAGCTSPDLALLSTPGTRTGDPPPEKGKIGTIHGSTYPERSVWAVYDLVEFRLTPIVPAAYYKELITIEVFGWRENKTITTTLRFKILGSEVGRRVVFPKGEWDAILQWQVRVWWSAGSRPTREEFQFLIDDVIVEEYALGSNDYGCRYPIQTPTGPAGAVVTLGFDDIPTAVNSSTLPPNLYHDYVFDQRYGSWKVVNQLSYPAGSPGRRTSALTKPNSLLGTPKTRETWYSDPNIIATRDFLFDIESLHISLDNTTTETQDPSNLIVMINAIVPCSPDLLGGYEVGPSNIVEAPSFSFTINFKGKGFSKYRGISILVMDYGRYEYIPFWIDDIKVKSWKNSLGMLPGCERCGYRLDAWCEYPFQDRPAPEELRGGED